MLEGPNLYFATPGDQGQPRAARLPRPPTSRRRALARRLGMRSARPGAPGTEQRQRFVMRVVARPCARVAAESGATAAGRARPARQRRPRSSSGLRLAHRTRARGARGAARAVLAGLLDGAAVAEPSTAEPARSPAAGPGDRPAVITPPIPVASVTGTNGKTTTTRLLGHIVHDRRAADGWSVDRRRRRAGRDRSRRATTPGPAGARGVLETARRPDRHPRDRPRRHAAQGHGGHRQRRLRRHQRLRRPPRPAGHRHRRPARRGQGHRHHGHQAAGLGRAQR